MQWMADPDGDPATADFAQVVSNSWDSTTDTTKISPEESVFCVAVKNLLNLGIIPVVAAGNDGPGAGTIQVPAACPGAVAVAASNEADGIADFSSRGPVKWKNMSLAKPDVSAPGEDIESAAPGGGYATKSGTSMATPHVSGAVALLLQARPGADPATIRRILLDTAKDIAATGPDDESGAGLIDVDRATRRALGVN